MYWGDMNFVAAKYLWKRCGSCPNKSGHGFSSPNVPVLFMTISCNSMRGLKVKTWWRVSMTAWWAHRCGMRSAAVWASRRLALGEQQHLHCLVQPGIYSDEGWPTSALPQVKTDGELKGLYHYRNTLHAGGQFRMGLHFSYLQSVIMYIHSL